MTTAVKERPILFSTDMVRAILREENPKTQTRRIVKPQPPEVCAKLCGPERYEPIVVGRDGEERPGKPVYGVYSEDGEWGCKCPWEPGMRLWVRCEYKIRYDAQFNLTYWSTPFGFWTTHGRAMRRDGKPMREGCKPGMHMPYWLSCELFPKLEVMEVRVQRLQDISEADAKAEGVDTVAIDGRAYTAQTANCYRLGFQQLWDSINERNHPWAANPWVWAISFRRLP